MTALLCRSVPIFTSQVVNIDKTLVFVEEQRSWEVCFRV